MASQKDLFEKYLNPVFVETGSYRGVGIEQAIFAGFKTIYSIESDIDFYNFCVDIFKDYPFVHLIQGDSGKILGNIISEITEPITFWLDGHNDGEYPVLKELSAIRTHPIKTHTIIIDDLRMMKKEIAGFDIEDIKNECLKINPRYQFILEDGFTNAGIVLKDILIAKT